MSPIKISYEASRVLDNLSHELTPMERVAILKTAASAIENSLSAEAMIQVLKNTLEPR